ncbi:hypothetical protein [Virgibacillus litoralis]|uniref:Positive regulator of sigma E activity n=1 Tax=Virgibacillus litoralis TaxID=578221 RepID=A0ABS4H9H6_9BACI|nr:hypothetical protein [Virgibacillus litoralis]MBP1947561.1 positive regulator of sigma E activity [Virgibacillus litoralis]
MSDRRIATVVEEIHYWKEHNLLPDVYCDFLLAIYTNGEGVEEEIVGKKINIVKAIQLTLLSLLLPFAFLVIYFTEFRASLQVSTLFLFVIYSYWMSRIYSQKISIYYHLSIVTFLLLLLLMSIYISTLFTANQWFLQFVMIMNVISWFILSRRFDIKYLKIVSIFGIAFVILYIVLQKFHILSL